VAPAGNELFNKEQVKAFLLKHERTIQHYAVDSDYQQMLMWKFTISRFS